MYRESPYSTENEAYIFGQYSNTINFDGNSLFNEISQSINQMSLQSPQKPLSVQKKKVTYDPKKFLKQFNQLAQNCDMKQEYQQCYCAVCSRMCNIIPSNAVDKQDIAVTCTSCSKQICKKCVEICDRCSQSFCKFCSQIRYEGRGDYVFCEICLV